jgi:hypothetical protein
MSTKRIRRAEAAKLGTIIGKLEMLRHTMREPSQRVKDEMRDAKDHLLLALAAIELELSA